MSVASRKIWSAEIWNGMLWDDVQQCRDTGRVCASVAGLAATVTLDNTFICYADGRLRRRLTWTNSGQQGCIISFFFIFILLFCLSSFIFYFLLILLFLSYVLLLSSSFLDIFLHTLFRFCLLLSRFCLFYSINIFLPFLLVVNCTGIFLECHFSINKHVCDSLPGSSLPGKDSASCRQPIESTAL
jgi:hypothetical protein